MCASLLRHLTGDNLVSGRVDNLYTRMLNGLPHGSACPLGCVNASHLARARHMLSKFVVIPTAAIHWGMRALVERTRHSSTLQLQLPANGPLHVHRSAEYIRYSGNGSSSRGVFARRWGEWDRVPSCIALQQKIVSINWADSALYGYALEAWVQDGGRKN